MWLTGPAAPRHVGSSQTRARTRVPCIGRQILNHRATREAQETMFLARVRGVLKAHSQSLNENLVLSPWHTWKSRLPLEFTRNLPLPFPTPIFFHGYFLTWTGQQLKWEVGPHKQMQLNNLDKWPPTQVQG